MSSLNSQLESVITQLRSQNIKTNEVFEQVLTELEIQTAENEKQHQKQLEQLKEEHRKWDQEKATMEKIVASASPVINLNVGGTKITTRRATLTLIDGTLLATMFSGKWEDKLQKDADGCIFLDYDPVLFQWLLNQLDTWTDSSVKRVFRPPIKSEQAYTDFVRSLQFDERYLHDGRTVTGSASEVVQSEEEDAQPVASGKSITTIAATVEQPKVEVKPPFVGGTATTHDTTVEQSEQKVERFRVTNSSYVRLSDKDQRCEKTGETKDWQCVFGTLDYSTGTHRIRFKIEKGSFDVLLGLCSRNKPPKGSYFYDKPTTHGWLTHGYMIRNGQLLQPGCSGDENDILELTINCNERSLSILNERSKAKNSMQVDINQAPFPWCLLVLLHYEGGRVSLV